MTEKAKPSMEKPKTPTEPPQNRSKPAENAAEPAQSAASPRYNQNQLKRTLGQIEKRKSARAEAKEEEREYVEYRKAMVFATVQPTVGTMKSTEDTYPVKKNNMRFGERKAHYLAIRPNPKYALFLGSKKGIIEAKARVATTANVQFTDHSSIKTVSTPSTKSSESKTKKVKPSKKKEADPICVDHAVIDNKDSKLDYPGCQEEEAKDRQKGNNADRAIVNGVPFWAMSDAQEQDELTDDDLPIDMSLLEKVCNSEVTLPDPPFRKTVFNPFGPVERFQKDDPLFDRETTLFVDTVETVIGLQVEDNREYIPHKPIVPKIKWADKITVTVFDPLDREAPESKPITEPLKDIKREKGAKS